ncbi:hypothetical protein M413DRAFT_121071 [Hebeloma cylindrosporum]|uniref:SH3 domain-containing protein n=1 Tax=Hebeloma cylindrosporum TaxID=76867 RepID=A0A0C2XYF1_HEBCY|nr:hypothetical protein M413DRAFT_121071 [Hebeloma cylindrosporum h7]
MASAVYSEPPASRLSIALEGEASASPFPSPSSSFLPPPTPGAHEFAVKLPPSARNGRKSSAPHISNPSAEPSNGDVAELPRSQRSSLNGVNGSKESTLPIPLSPALVSPMTPTPSNMKHLEPPRSPLPEQSTSSSTTPTVFTTPLPPESESTEIIIPDTLAGANGPASPAFSTSSRRASASINPDLYSNRPAPPSPAISRRVSGAPSTSSTRSRPPSTVISRANSLRKSASVKSARGSPVINPHRQSLGGQLSQQSFAPLPSPQNLTFSLNVPSTSAVPPPQSHVSAVVHVKIRDFGFPPTDERHIGLGPDVPKSNTVHRMNRRLGPRTMSQGSIESSDGEEKKEVEDESWDGTGGWDGFRMGLGRLSWNNVGGTSTAATVLEEEAKGSGFPSRMDLDRNFLDDADLDEEEYYDANGVVNDEDDDDDEEDALYPGLYRALYAFEPEGTAEMRLEEDQVVRVIGRGGGVGWAVVIDEKGTAEEAEAEGLAREMVAPKHALVPESYLEPVRLDWEDEEAKTGLVEL